MAGVDGERELEEFLAGALAGKVEEEPQPEVEETEEVVRDQPEAEVEDTTPTPPVSPPVGEEKPAEEQPETEEAEEQEPHVSWATQRFGKDTERWAKALYDREQFISQLAADKKAAEEMAQEAITYARSVEAQAQATVTSGLPLSASEEEWVEQSMMNPAAAAYQAARGGNVQLYNAVIERVAMDNPGMAANIGTQVQMALQEELNREQAARSQNGGQPPQDFNADMAGSFQRLGIDVQKYGPSMWEKVEELGEYHPYALAILGGDHVQRDLALQAVYDLVRTGQTTTRRVAETEREEQIRREGELRRDAAGVVTGAPHVPPVKQSPFFDAMEEEWRRRGQWTGEE